MHLYRYAQNTHVESTSHQEKIIAAIGVQDLVIIDTPDALLVADSFKSQDVKLVVEALKTSGILILPNCRALCAGPGALTRP